MTSPKQAIQARFEARQTIPRPVQDAPEGAQKSPKVLNLLNAQSEQVHEQLGEQVRRKTPDGVILTRASDLKITPIIWLWRDWLACGKLHLLAGAPGQGKTTIALSLAATVTSGGRWPDGSRCPVGSALIWSGEDDPADTLAPRLKAMGADMDRVYFVSGARVDGEEQPFDPARDLIQLAAAVERIGDVRLIVVDPIVSAVAGDSHKNTEVRRAMQPLVDMAATAGAAVVGITHLSKGTAGRDPTERVTGSIAFTAVVRVVLMAAKVKGEDGEDRRILARSKSNIGPDNGGFVYSLEQTEAIPGVQASAVRWGEAIEGTARELLAESETDRDDDEGSAKGRAEAWLIELLAGGAIQAKQVQADAKEAGLSWATVRRAADSLNVARIKDGLRGGWYWRINDRLRDQAAQGAHEGAHEGAHPEQ